MKQILNFGSDFAILNIAHTFGHTQQKIWNFMLFFAFKNIQTQKEHKISIARLSAHLNIKDLNKIKEKLFEMVDDDHNLNLIYY